jgi:hypothetical protein
MLLTAAFLFLLAPWMAAQAADITVDESICTLADAITAANTDTATGDCPAGDSGADTIILEADVTLAAALPQISSPVTIEGGGHFISGNNDENVGSVLHITATGNLTLNEITVKDGNKMGNGERTKGGGIYNEGTVTLTNSTVSGNTVYDPSSSKGWAAGGGIYNDNNGTVTLTNSTVSGNTASPSPRYSSGGGIHNVGTVILTNSTVSGNTAYSSWSYGGGIYNDGTVTLMNSTVSGNTSSSSIFASASHSSSHGGGICSLNGTVTLTNSTVSGNTAISSSSGSWSAGGGIYNDNEGIVTLTNSTVSGNTVAVASIYYSGGGICNYRGRGTITLQSTVISGNMANNHSNEIYNHGPVNVASYNVFGHSGETGGQAFSGFTPGGSDVNATSNGGAPTTLDAILNTTLASNGGPTLTHALVAGSPAIDLDADCSIGLTTDQRGMPRPSGVGCDAGAVEYSPSAGTACGNGRNLPANTWLMTAPSCQPADPPGTGIDAQYGNDIPGGVYGTDWIGWQWDADQQKYPPAMAGTDPLVLGTGNWVYSTTAGILVLDGTATTTEPCSDYGPGLTGQCFAIDLVPSAGAALWQIVGHPFPYTANWADVRVAAFDGTTWTQRTPSEAETADLMLKTFWRWTGSAYESHDDSTPGMLGILQPQESFWVRILPGSSAFNVEGIKLLIPAR